jgi:hypothetical protein
VALAARKLPEAREVRAGTPLVHEPTAVRVADQADEHV